MTTRRVAATGLAALGGAAMVALAFLRGGQSAAAADPVSIVVTSAADGDSAVCPDDARCTLRRAIELANEGDAGESFVITFDSTAFPEGSWTAITPASALPELTHDDVAVDATGGRAVVDGSELAGGEDGFVLSGDRPTLRGLGLVNMTGACLVVDGTDALVGGDDAAGEGVQAGGCATGILITGNGAKLTGNRLGFVPGGTDAAAVTTGIEVDAGAAEIGGEGISAGLANVVGHAATAIRVGDGSGDAFDGVIIAGNVVGRDRSGSAAGVDIGVELEQPSNGTAVLGNTLWNATLAAIQVVPDVGDVPVNGNRFQGNRFLNIGGLAVDLNADGVRNDNDPGDEDGGPNGMLNYPIITRATQARISGTAGAGCPGCRVELYFASHSEGAADDDARDPVGIGLATTGADGSFAFDSPPVTPGTWVVAAVTDQHGNTSEFGPSARVGSGAVQCGNVGLQMGWNHAGYFGAGPLTLGATFPESGPGSVRAIYHLEDGSSSYTHWIAGTPIGRTLTTLEPGEAYWFLVDESFVLPSGFSLSVGLPVQLAEGWNDFVYIGAAAEVQDALSSISGSYAEVYRYANDGAGERWLSFGTPETPGWAREFDLMESCGSYTIRMTSAATLQPLQP